MNCTPPIARKYLATNHKADIDGAVKAAISDETLEILALLLKRRASSFDTPIARDGIFLAGWGGHLQALEMLKSAGKLSTGKHLNLALCYAIEKGHLAVAKFLVDSGACLNSTHGVNGFTPLFSAVTSTSEGSVSFRDRIVPYLLDKGAIIDTRQLQTGETALLGATANKMITTMEILLSRGADPSIKDNNGRNVLEKASRASLKDAYPLLVTLDGPSHQEHYVQAFFYAAQTDDRDLLLSVWDKVKNKNVWDNDGHTALIVAINNRSLLVYLLMLRKGADFNARDKHNVSPWLLASKKGMDKLVKGMVANKRCSLEERDSKGDTALMLASQSVATRSYINTVEILRKAGAKRKAVNDYGETAQDIVDAR